MTFWGGAELQVDSRPPFRRLYHSECILYVIANTLEAVFFRVMYDRGEGSVSVSDSEWNVWFLHRCGSIRQLLIDEIFFLEQIDCSLYKVILMCLVVENRCHTSRSHSYMALLDLKTLL